MYADSYNVQFTIKCTERESYRLYNKNSDGLPVIGASILVKGTTNGIISDLDGNYILENVPMESTLIYSFVGYDTQNIVYKGQSKIDVQLKTSAIALEEVVAIGYEVKKKSVVTGAISSIDSDDLLQSNQQMP